jgi:hypothetical protein
VRSVARWSGASLLACLLLGCGDGTDQDEKSRASWCNAVCSAYGRCESSVSPSCSSDCQAGNQGFLVRSSAEALDRQTECMQRASCTPEFNDLLGECYSETLAGLEPSPEAMELCTAMAEPFFECNWFGTPQSCGQFHAAFSGPALAAERECSFASCEALGDCIAAQLYSFGE